MKIETVEIKKWPELKKTLKEKRHDDQIAYETANGSLEWQIRGIKRMYEEIQLQNEKLKKMIRLKKYDNRIKGKKPRRKL